MTLGKRKLNLIDEKYVNLFIDILNYAHLIYIRHDSEDELDKLSKQHVYETHLNYFNSTDKSLLKKQFNLTEEEYNILMDSKENEQKKQIIFDIFFSAEYNRDQFNKFPLAVLSLF